MISAFIAMQGSFTSAKFGSWVRMPTWHVRSTSNCNISQGLPVSHTGQSIIQALRLPQSPQTGTLPAPMRGRLNPGIKLL